MVSSRFAIAPLLLLVNPATVLGSSNHLVNAHFGSSLAYWTPTPSTGYTITQTTAVGDAAAGAASVAGLVSTIDSEVVLTQCAAVKEGFTYNTHASFRFEPGYPEKPYAVVHSTWYSGTACTGDALGSFDSNASDPTSLSGGIWQHLQSLAAAAPAGAQSVLVGILEYHQAPGSFQTYVDDVFFGGSGLTGDANLDEAVNVADVFYLINFLFAGGPAPFGPSDVNDTDAIDVADVFYLINYLFAGGPAPQ